MGHGSFQFVLVSVTKLEQCASAEKEQPILSALYQKPVDL